MNYSQLHPARYAPGVECTVLTGEYSYAPIRRHLPAHPEARILEVRCGCASLLACLRAHGYFNARGLDHDQSLAARGEAVLDV
jgi:hypothetical protein